MARYDKLVRDNIPDIIVAQGRTPVVTALSDADFKERLRKKLLEETQEYLESGEAISCGYSGGRLCACRGAGRYLG